VLFLLSRPPRANRIRCAAMLAKLWPILTEIGLHRSRRWAADSLQAPETPPPGALGPGASFLLRLAVALHLFWDADSL
jgi:hypothetical protein